MALPPTAVGVMADVNSHIISTLMALRHDRSLPASVLKRHDSPKSRPNMHSQASTTAHTAPLVHSTDRHVSAVKSCRNNSQNTLPPISTGSSTLSNVDVIFFPAGIITYQSEVRAVINSSVALTGSDASDIARPTATPLNPAAFMTGIS